MERQLADRKDEIKQLSETILYKQYFLITLIGTIVILISIIITGSINYLVARNASIAKLKEKDLIYIEGSISEKINGKIQKARETSLNLARDPLVIQWIMDHEQEESYGTMVKEKLFYIARDYDYTNSFVVSALTNRYWSESGEMLGVMDPLDPADQWFFDTLREDEAVQCVIDYNIDRENTFVFINGLIYAEGIPIGVAGVGFDLENIAHEFQEYTAGTDSNIWLIDREGIIQLADDMAYRGKEIQGFLPESIWQRMIAEVDAGGNTTYISEYVLQKEVIDLVYTNIPDTQWYLLLQVPRKESLASIEQIKVNVIFSGLAIAALLSFLLYIGMKRFYNPVKKNGQIESQLSQLIHQQTIELKEKNKNIMDSIYYAERIQHAILPANKKLAQAFRDYFVLWRSKDVVGGDFYWFKQLDDGYLISVIDCTGHGVPGAFMTMAVNSILDHIFETNPLLSPAEILQQLNTSIKQTLNKDMAGDNMAADDGLDIGICKIQTGKTLIFSGARIALYKVGHGEFQTYKGDRKSIGYKSIDNNYQFTDHQVELRPEDTLYMTTDGLIHQNGGPKGVAFGTNRWETFLRKNDGIPLSDQKNALEKELDLYMQGQEQRDDMTVIGFRI